MIKVMIEHNWIGTGDNLAEAIKDADPRDDLTPYDVEVWEVKYRAWNGSDGKEVFEDIESAEYWLESQGLEYAGDSLSGDARYYTPSGELDPDDDEGAYTPCICEEEEVLRVSDEALWKVLEDLGLAEDEDEDD